MKWERGHGRLFALSVLNILVLLSWYALRQAHDAGEDYPLLTLLLMLLTALVWWQLIAALVSASGGNGGRGQ